MNDVYVLSFATSRFHLKNTVSSSFFHAVATGSAFDQHVVRVELDISIVLVSSEFIVVDTWGRLFRRSDVLVLSLCFILKVFVTCPCFLPYNCYQQKYTLSTSVVI